MKTRLKAALAGVATAALTGALLVGAPAAQALTSDPSNDPSAIGTIGFYNASGTQIFSGNLADQPFAAYAVASSNGGFTNTKAQLWAAQPASSTPDQWVFNAVSGNTTTPPTTGPFAGSSTPVASGASTNAKLSTILGNFAAPTSGTYANLYQMRLISDASGAQQPSAQYWATWIQVNTTAGTWQQVFPNPPEFTATTNVSVTPSGASQPFQTAVTLSATSTDSSTPATSLQGKGTIHFFDGATDLGTGSAISSAGGSSLSLTPAPGPHAFTAKFVPTDSTQFQASVSATATAITVSNYKFTDGSGGNVQAGLAIGVAAGLFNSGENVSVSLDGTTDVTPSGLTADGSGAVSTSVTIPGSTTVGSHNLVFTGAVSGSAKAVTVPISVTSLSVSLAVTPSTGPAYSSVTLSANVSKTISGTIQFFDGSAAIGLASTLPDTSTGMTYAQTFSGGFAAGTHSFTAVFTPSLSSNGGPVTSQAVAAAYTSVATASTDKQAFQAQVDPGTITISTPYTAQNPFNLGHLTLTADGQNLTNNGVAFGKTNAAADAQGITVTDTRSGDQGWTATAWATDFTSGTDSISAQNLSFTSLVAGAPSGDAMSAAGRLSAPNFTLTPITSSSVHAKASSGTDGLAGTATDHAFATAVHGAGTTWIGGTLTLTAPASTTAGTYYGTVTFTVS